ncbi:ArsR/SmtB family transcription factor [Nocardioides sp. GXZ039]|uniref:ArsR/SmtB family transcription factor n=1 Tax=Nocardioides sp. GXZ039 TaxID=3136018 RepID=UPI0030F41104
MDPVFAALADPHRRTIIELLGDGPRNVTTLAAALPIARPGVSRHLRVLREAGIVTAEAHAQERVYTLVPESLREADEWLSARAGFWRQRLDALDTELRRNS